MIRQTSASELVSGVQIKKPPTAPVVSNVLDPEDVADLRDYSKGDGHYMPDHSTFAAALLRAELRSMGCTGCKRCGGSKTKTGKGFVPKELSELEPEPQRRPKRKPVAGKKRQRRQLFKTVYGRALRAYRKQQAKRHGWMIATTPRQRDALRARGNEAYTRSELASYFPDLPELLLKLCPKCKGIGTIPRLSKERKRNDKLTARPTGSSKRPAEGGGVELDEEALHRRGKTDRRLAEVRKRLAKGTPHFVHDDRYGGDVLIGVLETYFAPGNETLKSLWPFTKHGRMLLDAPNPNGLTVRARVTALLDAVHLSKDREKQGWIDLADKQAQDLLDLYVRTWNTIVAELVARSSIDRNGRRLKLDREVMIFDGGKKVRGRIEGQSREFWRVRVSKQITRHVAGWHLERVA